MSLKKSEIKISDREQLEKRRESMSTRKDSSDSLLSNPVSHISRRRSTLKSLSHSISGILGLRRSLTKIKEDFQHKQKLENTYQMHPENENTFTGLKVRQIVEEIMEQEISDSQYDHEIARQMACDLAVKIKARLKDMNLPRYKILCQCIVGQVKDQGLEAASRCVWDPKTDNYACVSYKNNSIFAIALIHGVYYE